MIQETKTRKRGSFAAAFQDLSTSPRQDFLASIVVFLVALPLCMGIAIASGVPVAAGLITGIIGGLVVGWFAGAPLQVSGPAAGLTVIVYDLVQHHGLEVLGIAVLLAGLLQFIAGLLGYGRVFRAVSPAVIHGMLAGIGVLIFSSQFHVMVDDSPKGSGVQNLLSIPDAIQKGLPMPELRTEEERSSRRDLIQEFGTLHEQQVQLRELAAEQIPIDFPSTSPHANTQPPDNSRLRALVEKQQKLYEQLTHLVAQINTQKAAKTVRDPDSLRQAARHSLNQARIALHELERGNAQAIKASQAELQQTLEALQDQLKSHDWAAKIGLLTILSLVLWKVVAPGKMKRIPAPLVAVIVATTVTAILKLPVLYVEVPDNLWSEVHFPSWPVMKTLSWGTVLKAGIVLAVVASAETLLCATAVDQMQTGMRTDYDKELAAQGIGNMICGLCGALPMTGVVVRSSANIEVGAKTRLSAILHGAWLLIFVSLLSFLLRMIPTAALAGILVYIGYKLVNTKAIQELLQFGRGEVAIYAATLITIVVTDLLTGVITGIVLSAVKLLHKFCYFKVSLEIDPDRKAAVLKMVGSATFLRLPRLAHALDQVPDSSELHVDFERLAHIDHACLDLLMNWAKRHEAMGGTLVIDWDSLHANFHTRAHGTGKPVQKNSA